MKDVALGFFTTINWPKLIPPLVSIAIIIVVAILRDRSRLAAVVFATMPTNLPLALWITFGSTPATPAQLTTFVGALLWGLTSTVLWALVVFFAVRSGWNIYQAIGAGYVAWAALLATLMATGVINVR